MFIATTSGISSTIEGTIEARFVEIPCIQSSTFEVGETGSTLEPTFSDKESLNEAMSTVFSQMICDIAYTCSRIKCAVASRS